MIEGDCNHCDHFDCPSITTVPDSEEQAAEDEEIEEWLRLFVHNAVIAESTKTADDIRQVRAVLDKLEQRLTRLETQRTARNTGPNSKVDMSGLKKLSVTLGLISAAILLVRHGIIPLLVFTDRRVGKCIDRRIGAVQPDPGYVLLVLLWACEHG